MRLRRRIGTIAAGLMMAGGIIAISPTAASAAYPCYAYRDWTASWKVVSTCPTHPAGWWHQAWARCTVQGNTTYYWGNVASGYSDSVVYCPGATSGITSYGTIQGSA